MNSKTQFSPSARPSRAWRTPAFAAGSTFLLAASALAGTAPTDTFVGQKLASHPTSGWSSVIVKTNGDLTAAQEAQVKSLGGDIYRRLSLIQSVGVRVPSRNLSKLASLPFVAHVSEDSAVKKSDAFTVGSSEAALATAMGSYNRPYQLTGRGVTVAILDSGITPVPDLSQSNNPFAQASSRILASVNLSNALPSNGQGGVTFSVNTNGGGSSLINNGNSYDPCGHGTHIAGIIAGNGSHSPALYCSQHFWASRRRPTWSMSACWIRTAKPVSARSFPAFSGWSPTRASTTSAIVNLSLGHPVGESYTTDPLCQAVEAAWKAGIVVVCAAGNNGRANAVSTPGMDNEG